LIADVALFEGAVNTVGETLSVQLLELRYATYLPELCRRARIGVLWSGRPSHYIAVSRDDDEVRGTFLTRTEAESRFVGAT
jgi:hypothetical protein